MLKKLVLTVLVVVVALGAAVWWFVLRDDPPEELSVGEGDPSAVDTGEAPETLDGTWVVQTGDETEAGFRIEETLASGLTEHTAVGRSPGVSGSVAIAGTSITEGSFTVDLTELEFTDDPGFPVANRANALRGRGLQTDTFPEATLELTAPVELGAVPAEGELVTASVTGDLTLHGVTQEVTFEVEARLEGSTIRVATKDPVPVVLADYDIERPTAPMVADVAEEGSFEFLVILVPE